MITIINTEGFRHVPEMSCYNNNVYTNWKVYILEEAEDDEYYCRYYEVVPNNEVPDPNKTVIKVLYDIVKELGWGCANNPDYFGIFNDSEGPGEYELDTNIS